MFDDFAVGIYAEHIHAGPLAVTRKILKSMDDDEVAFGNRPPELHAGIGVVFSHLIKVVDKTLFTCGHTRIVLDVVLTNI